MKRLLISAIALSTLVVTGCVVVPARGYYYPHPHYYHPAAVIVP